MRCRCRAAALPAVLVGMLLGPLPAAARAETRNVLVLSSSERPFAPQSGFADALVRDLIRSSRDPIQFVEVPIQAARASGEAPGVSVAQHIRSAFAGEKRDLVITIGGPAALFAQQFRHELFPDTPMLIAGVDRRFVETGSFSDNEATVVTQHDPARMIDEILRLLPDTRSVMVVVGSSQVERFWLQQMQRDFQRFGNRLQFSWTDGLSFDEIKERSRTMPPQSAIFFALLSLDGKGEPQVGDTLSLLHAVANAPMFALYGLGNGIVGGPLLSTADLSRTTTQVALRMLAGEVPGTIKTPVQRTGQPTYDAREMRRWNIDERRLPAASVVLFREPTGWQRNRSLVLVALGGIPLLALVVFVGLVKPRRARGRSSETAAVLIPHADALVKTWTVGADGRRAMAGHEAVSGPNSSLPPLIHPDDVGRCAETIRHALETHEPFQMEYRIREEDGTERWMLDTGVVKFSGAVFDGYVGSAVDVTTLGRARAELSNLSRHLIEEHEQERAALARRLHDNVCQRMVVLTLRLHSLQGAAHDAEVADIREALSNLVSEIATVSDPVYGRLELRGLVPASQQFCEELSARYEVAINFQDEGVPRDLPLDLALALFRVLQEATVNAAVHSRSPEIRVSLRGAAGEVRLQVVDRGIGFDRERMMPGAGLGLVAIRERINHVHGDSLIVSAPGEGTRVEARVPLPIDRRPAIS